MEPWRVRIPVVADSHYFNEKQDLETHHSEKSDTVRITGKIYIRIRLNVMRIPNPVHEYT
jgi:hypothetical protein